MIKFSQPLKKFTNFTSNNSVILRIEDAKASAYCFYMKAHIRRYFQIYISVPSK